jgi:transcription antitermination factor NusG
VGTIQWRGDLEGLPWYAVRVKSNFEHNVACSLRSKGYEEFLPTYRSRRRWSDRIKDIDKPLFSGYVFCRLDIKARLPLLMTPGVVNIVGIGKVSIPIPTEEIEAVRAIANSSLLASPWPFLHVGQRVRLTDGPLTDVEGSLIKLRNQWRVVVSIMLLQRSVAVEVDASWVEPLPQSAQRLDLGNTTLCAGAGADLRVRVDSVRLS